jgi:DNA-binding LacI/PurR family transcriptional regulator
VGQLATEHLIQTGRTRIAHISYSASGIYAADQRRSGYLQAMNAAGLDVPTAYQVQANFSMQSGYEAMVALLALKKRPDAIFASSDAVAIGAMAAIQDAKLSIPNDIAVAGVDDIGAAAFNRPSLTTVTSRPYDTGALAADMLMSLMSGTKPAKRHMTIETELVVRGSTAGASLKADAESSGSEA